MREDDAGGGGGFVVVVVVVIILCLPSTSSLPCLPDQRHALLRFRHSLTISGPIVASWTEDDQDCCSWDGISCDNSTGDVIGLDLTSAGLHGPINSSSPLFSLRHLRRLSLQGNDLLGSTVPKEIGVFIRMEYLDLSDSNISGILPTEISHLSKLLSLDFSGNIFLELKDHTMRMLVGNLTQLEELNLGFVDMSEVMNPTSLLNLSSSLISLELSGCSLGGKFPEFIFGLPNLQVIDISWNHDLTGTLPKSKWSPSLDYLSLSGCNFIGAVPNSIGNLSRLTHMDLSGNNFMGAVPNSIGSLSLLAYLYLWGNNFTGAVPDSIGSLSRLTHMDLSGNNITGAVPTSIGNLSRLTYLELSGNNFTLELGILSTLEKLQLLDLSGISISGEEANHDFSLPKLQGLSMDSCNLTRFPSFLSRSVELRYLSLEGNSIPEIPGWLWSTGVDSLDELYLGDNIIRGSIPPSMCRLTCLSHIILGGNQLTGVVPQCLGNLTKLQWLDVSDNTLSGSLPPSLANCTLLWRLVVGNNSIGGDSPATWLFKSSITFINLSDNKFEGPLPMPSYATNFYSVSSNHFSGNPSLLMCNATSLLILDLSYNKLTGVLPDCLKNITAHLLYLNLRANEFHGKIPDIFHEASSLTSLDLGMNQFEGPLPRSLSHCKYLEALEVGNNRILDSFPNWLGGLPLKVISLRSNRFHGHVNTSRGTHPFTMARIMDLSRNSFDGNLQDEFISEMLDMRGDSYDFGYQYMRINSVSEYYSVMIDLKGIEMEMVKINVQFAMLDLSSNQFHGEIPKSIGLLKSLKGLNFSRNRFTGSIPPSVGNLVNLESLDLSSNHLMGEIPKELVKLTSLGFLDLSSNNLTGPIPSGGHLDTFPNSSFDGNPGLCGIPLTRSCVHGVQQPPMEGKEDGGGWTVWKYVVLGFGSGMGMGITLGYMVLEMGRPLWLVRIVIRLEDSYKKMTKRKKKKGVLRPKRRIPT